MEQYVDMKSPFTGGRVKEIFTTEVQEFRKENYTVHARYYVCEDTGEKFTTTEQDELASFIISLLDSSREQFTEAEYMKIRNSILSAPEESTSDKLAALFYSDTQCSVYNGFGSLDTNKVANMVKFFIHKEGSVFPTKLNKEMFYADFAHYRKHGRSISGLRYKAIKYGPVPFHYDTIYDNIDGVEKNIVISHNSESTCLSCDGYDSKSFSAI